MITRILSQRSFFNILIIGIFCTALSACGGGGGGGMPSSDNGGVTNPPLAENFAPVANAGADQTASAAQTVLLDGSASSDADGDIATYVWEQTEGPEVELSSADTSKASFTAPSVTEATILVFRVSVADDQGATSSDTVQVAVTRPQYTMTSYGMTASQPSVITMGIGVKDRITGLPVTDLKVDSEMSDFLVLEDGSAIASREAFLDLEPIENIPNELKTVLMIDVSSSLTAADVNKVKEAATNIVTNLAGNQQVAIYVFDDTIRQVIGFSSDAEQLTQAIENIELGGPSTNLYGAVVQGFSLWSNAFSLNQITYGTLILLTDGDDTAGLSSLDAAISAKGNRELFALSVGDGSNRDILVQLVLGTALDEVSQTDQELAARRLVAVDDYSQVDHALQQIAAEVKRLTEGVYFLYYATPKRAGTHEVSVSITGNTPCDSWDYYCIDTLAGMFSADGFYSVIPELILSYPGQWLTSGEGYDLGARVRWANPPFTYLWELTNSDGEMTLEVDSQDSSKATLTVAPGAQLSEGSVHFEVLEFSSMVEDLPYSLGIPLSDGEGTLTPDSVIALTASDTTAVLTAGIDCPECTWTIGDSLVAVASSSTGQSITLSRGDDAGTTSITVTDPLTSQSTRYAVDVTYGFQSPSQITTGVYHSCVLDEKDVHCWGYNVHGQSTVPALSNPVQVSAGGANHTCAIDDNGLHCWGYNGYGQTDVPALSNPRQVSTGGGHTCALDDSGLHCWGYNEYGQTDVPALSNPRQVTTGGSHTCALDNAGVHCWGSNGSGQTTVPILSSPTQVSTDSSHTCAIDDTGLVCWGNNNYGQTTVPALNNPSQVSTGAYHTCALDEDGVQCWGYNGSGQTSVPSLSAPRQVSAGREHACALDDSGVRCWGYNAYGQTSVPW
jgi:hypothetical protein